MKVNDDDDETNVYTKNYLRLVFLYVKKYRVDAFSSLGASMKTLLALAVGDGWFKVVLPVADVA